MVTDPFTEFLLGCNPVVVECERLGNYATARQESFGHASHRIMLAAHRVQRAKFHQRHGRVLYVPEKREAA